MNENNINKNINQKSLKIFFVKLISTSIVIIIVINLIFNSIFTEKLEKLDKILSLDRSDVRQDMKNKIINELNDALKKDNLIYEEDKILLYKLYKKLEKEFQDIDKSKL